MAHRVIFFQNPIWKSPSERVETPLVPWSTYGWLMVSVSILGVQPEDSSILCILFWRLSNVKFVFGYDPAATLTGTYPNNGIPLLSISQCGIRNGEMEK